MCLDGVKLTHHNSSGKFATKLHSPREGGREAAVVDPAGDDVEEVDRAGEVQAELCSLHHIPQGQRAAEKKEGMYKWAEKLRAKRNGD